MINKKRRFFVIVLDSLGIGELPDAHLYNDAGSNTLGNISKATGGLHLPNLEALGLGNIEGVEVQSPSTFPKASYGRMSEASVGKDTTTGHWEMAGIITDPPFATYPEGFPLEMMERFNEVTGYGWLFAKAASGTSIIESLGPQHIKEKKPIVYTSADSVFQIAAHEGVIPLDEQYEICKKTRILMDEYNVCRVIARPFVGSVKDGFERTKNRRDFVISPKSKTMLETLNDSGIDVIGIGKIPDIFCHLGLSLELKASGNAETLDRVMDIIQGKIQIKEEKSANQGTFVFANLIDFDMLYGHRNDTQGYAGALEEFDKKIPALLSNLEEEDILIFTADHGCDPTTSSTDHSREYVPLLVCGKGIKSGVNLGTRNTFADISKTVLEYFGVENEGGLGTSFISEVIR
ncbi:MAG: phosphopentomutase [Deltaproteobacteria bacterium]|nr:phosphopentomutase [Deltaproteobacteria bacterium]